MIINIYMSSTLVYTKSYSSCQNLRLFNQIHYSTNRCDMNTLINEIDKAYASRKESDSSYELTKNDLEVIKMKLLTGNYTLSPLKLVLNSISPTAFVPFIDLEASLEDSLVLSCLGIVLTRELGQSSYFSKSCYSTYSDSKWLPHFFSEIENMNGLESLFYMDCSNSVNSISRERLLSKVFPILSYNKDLYRLIESFCNLPILSGEGKDYSLNKGIPPLKEIDNVLFNIILDDIDRDLEAELPTIQYVRFQHIFFFPFTDESDMNNCIGRINDILIKNDFIYPNTQLLLKGGSSINIANCSISLSDTGKGIVDLNYKMKES